MARSTFPTETTTDYGASAASSAQQLSTAQTVFPLAAQLDFTAPSPPLPLCLVQAAHFLTSKGQSLVATAQRFAPLGSSVHLAHLNHSLALLDTLVHQQDSQLQLAAALAPLRQALAAPQALSTMPVQCPAPKASFALEELLRQQCPAWYLLTALQLASTVSLTVCGKQTR